MTHAHAILLALIPLAYVAGAIPFGLIIGNSRGIDPRKSGSGNIGATNVGRLLGGKFFAFVFTLDVLKGLLPPLAAAWVVRHFFPTPDALVYLLWLLVGFSAILGHMFSCFIHFKGGKGVATSAGVVLGLFPYYTFAGLIAMALWIILFLWKRYVSLASIAAAIAFPIAYVALALVNRWPIAHQQLPLLLFAILVAGMITIKHRANIKRLRAGTEHRFTKK